MSKLDTKNIIKALLNVNSYATTLYACLLTLYEDLHELDSLELYARLKDDLGVEMPEENENKLQAILSAVTTTYFYTDLGMFVSVCKSLASGDPGVADFDFEDATALEILWGTYEVELNEDDRIEPEFAPSIDRYITQLLKLEAVDNEQIDDLEDVIPSYEEAITVMILELERQLKNVGFTDVVMPKFIDAD